MPKAVEVFARREPGEAGEEHRGDRDREHPLREHVDPECGIDRAGRQVRIDEPRGEERVDYEVEVDEAEPDRHRQHQDEHAPHGRIAPVEGESQPVVQPVEPGQRQEHLDDRPDHDRDRVDVELGVDRLRARHAEDKAGDNREVPEDGRQRRHREVLVAVEDPDDDPGDPEQDDDREQDPGERDRELFVAPGIAERRDDERREDDQERGDRAQAEQQKPEEGRRDAPGALALAFLEQLAEDRDERGRERSVRDERADEVRHLEGDRERVDLPSGAEVVRGHDLADEAEDARDAGGDREDRSRPGESPARGPLVHAARGPLIHAASIGMPPVGAVSCRRVSSRAMSSAPVPVTSSLRRA
jgi:hypothetical protein